eukprot:CAMPEP_0168844660 /NCGR_PEP_ID=MMETSP0727-20121128/8854_1 /TAXON_ID=265536 /ORGANISM="Amphiprora sp., Strain CCMP467" /LENGTH=239 /DNA_ID=CAMNT_0008898315 /DNA_START=12 /DNA_END=730 /DNA_ORIENTATION=+
MIPNQDRLFDDDDDDDEDKAPGNSSLQQRSSAEQEEELAASKAAMNAAFGLLPEESHHHQTGGPDNVIGGLVAALPAVAWGWSTTTTSNRVATSPRASDFICDRGIAARDHVGNLRLRTLVTQYLQQYRGAGSSKQKKRKIQREIIRVFKEQNRGARFVTKDKKSGRWFMVDDEDARIKVGQQLRYQLRRQDEEGAHDTGDGGSSTDNNSQSSIPDVVAAAATASGRTNQRRGRHKGGT